VTKIRETVEIKGISRFQGLVVSDPFVLFSGLYGDRVRWNHVSDHALTVLGIAPPELYINPLVLYHFMYFRQLLI